MGLTDATLRRSYVNNLEIRYILSMEVCLTLVI